jgi:hypothetical protein
MRGNGGSMVIHRFQRGADGLPCLVRVDTKMAQELGPLSQLLPSALGATPEEANLVTQKYTISAQPRLSAICKIG